MDDHYLKSELYQLVRRDDQIFEFLQQGSLDGIWYWDLENPEHEWLSPRFKEVFGYDEHEIPHTSAWWQENIFAEDLSVVLERANAHFEDAAVPYDQVVRYRHKNGSTVWVRCRGVAIRDDDGKPVRMLGCHTDVTPIKRAELELERKVEQLAASNAELERFAYIASHDMREPVRMMYSFAELLSELYEDGLDERGKRFLGYISEGSRRLERMLEDLLTLSRATSARLELGPVDTRALFERIQLIVDPLRDEEADTRLKLIGDFPTIIADEAKLERVFTNIVSNAFKFVRDGVEPLVRVEAKQRDESWIFSIEDNGIGIEPAYIDDIFGMFKRLNKRDDFEGSGIGLSVVRMLTLMHGGDVRVESTPGEGTTFRVELPNVASQLESDSEE